MIQIVQIKELTTLTFFIKQRNKVDFTSQKFNECEQQLYTYSRQGEEKGIFINDEFKIVFDEDSIIISLSKNEICDNLVKCLEVIDNRCDIVDAKLEFETAFKFGSYESLNSFFRKIHPVQKFLTGENDVNSYFCVKEMIDYAKYRLILSLTEDVLIKNIDGMEEEEEALRVSLSCIPNKECFYFGEALNLTFKELEKLVSKIEELATS